MSKTDYIYDAVDDFGLITSAEAKELGVSNAELVQQARRGKLARVGRGVYRVAVWPYQEAAPYAVAVKSVSPSAYLLGESVIALLGLTPTNPERIRVGAPERVRKDFGGGIVVEKRQPNEATTFYEGIPAQTMRGAVVDAAKTIGKARALQAAIEAAKQGYITAVEAEEIEEALR